MKNGGVEPRLRMAFRIAQFIAQQDSPGIVQSWFQGLNPELDDRSPRIRRLYPILLERPDAIDESISLEEQLADNVAA